MRTLLLAVTASAVLAAPASAQSPLAGAVLQSPVGQMTLTQTQCAAGASASDCGHQRLTFSFNGGQQRATEALTGAGKGTCSADSPPQIITAPDGSMQILGGAERIDPFATKATKIAIATGSRGLRWTWLEPVTPSYDCTYFDEAGTTLAVPSAGGIPASLSSRWIAPRVLKRSRFTVRIAGKETWATGSGTWTLTLHYTRASARRGSFVGRF